MFSGGVLICIGAAVISSSNVREQFIAGRFILGFGGTLRFRSQGPLVTRLTYVQTVSFMTAGAPAYIAEIPPVHWRGRMTAFYNLVNSVQLEKRQTLKLSDNLGLVRWIHPSRCDLSRNSRHQL